MARGKSNLTLEEKLQKVNTDIEATEQSLKMLKEQRKQLEADIKNQQLNALYDMIVKKGKTMDDVAALLDK